jgi:hypothetical protein
VGWDESTITWNIKPAANAAAISTQTLSGTAARWYEWDVTDYLRQQKVAAATAITFVLKGEASSSAYVRFASDEATDAATRPQLVVEQGSVDNVAPTVTEVLWNSSNWTPEFVASLLQSGMGEGGYALPSLPAPSRTLPWINPNKIIIRFSEDVRVQQDDLKITGVDVPNYAMRAFQYDSATFTATWTFAPGSAIDRLRFELDGDGPDAVTDAAGNKLNGGEGAASDYVRAVDLLAGDATGDGVVNALDVAFVKQRLNRSAGDAGFSPFADPNGDGKINALDLAAVKQRLNRRLPSAAPATALGAAPPSLFSPVLIGPITGPAADLAALLE